MSLKSFDKFCEKMILGEPASQKEILDERQKIIRTRIIAETLAVFSGLLAANSIVMDSVYQWCESYAMPIAIFVVISMIYYNIRCFFKECLIGVNGGGSVKFAAVYAIFMGVVMMLINLPESDKGYLFFSDGKATHDFMMLITWILFIVYGIVSLILIKITHKNKREEE